MEILVIIILLWFLWGFYSWYRRIQRKKEFAKLPIEVQRKRKRRAYFTIGIYFLIIIIAMILVSE